MNQGVSIMRKEKISHFTQVDNAILQSKELSMEAKGLLSWILSLPNDWVLNISYFYNPMHGPSSKHKVQKCMKELCANGYAKLEKVKKAGSSKLGGSRYIVDENRSFLNSDRDARIPTVGNSVTTNTYVIQTHIYDERDGGLEEPTATSNTQSLLTIKNHDGIGYGYTVEDWYAKCFEKGLKPTWMKDHASFKCLCPIHNEDKPSFNVSKGEKVSVVCKCFGCDNSFDDFSAVLFPVPRNSLSEEMHFIYTDEEGKPLYKIARTKADKKFWTQVPQDGVWVKAKASDVHRVPYRLHKLVQSMGTVYIVEGEKDVETAEEHGLTATCNPFGASAWKSSYAKYFANRDVVIVRDKDNAGAQWAVKVKASIGHLAKSVKIFETPVNTPGADLTDHYDAGYNVSQLIQVE